MTSESTRFFGQPRETKPTLGLLGAEMAGSKTAEGITLHSNRLRWVPLPPVKVSKVFILLKLVLDLLGKVFVFSRWCL